MSSLRAPTAQLLPGQAATRDDFLRRWEALPELKNAELIDGNVYLSSPVSNRHGRYEVLLHVWMGAHEAAAPGCEAGSNGTWFLLESAPQPDGDRRIFPRFGGQSRQEGDYCAGATELIAEMSGPSAARDYRPKLAPYQRAGVRECVTVAFEPPQVVWRELADDRYRPLTPDDGLVRSKVPGLWLDPQALLAQNTARVLESLSVGLASPGHAEFVERLRKAGRS